MERRVDVRASVVFHDEELCREAELECRSVHIGQHRERRFDVPRPQAILLRRGTSPRAVFSRLLSPLGTYRTGRSQAAAEHFAALGFENVHNLAGGIDAWSREVDPSVPRY